MPAFLWTQKEDIGPSPRHGHAMCFDAARQRTFLFGGADEAPLGDSWTWSGQNWTQVGDTGPAPRFDHAMCFDAARNNSLLFGGKSGDQRFGDTWSWSGEYWTQLEDSGPSPRFGHAMVYDPGQSQAVLFGGSSATGVMRDTWQWDGQSWTQVEDAGPPPRCYHGMAFDPTRATVVLFGGEDENGAGFRDTWEWNGSNWTQIEDIGPPACTRHSLVSAQGEIILFGGLSGSAANPPPTLFDDSWSLSASHWTQKQDMGPAGRWGHAMAFDTQRQTIVMFGGHTSLNFDDAQDLRGDTWEHTAAGAGPVNPPDGSQPSVASLGLDPTTSPVGQPVLAYVTLNQPAVDGTFLQLYWAPEGAIDASDPNNIQLVDPSMLQALVQYQILAGEVQFVAQFETPQTNGTIAIVATSDGMTAQIALLTVN